MRECARMFGERKGEQIHQLVEAATKGPCPCLVGDMCPLVKTRKVPALHLLLAPVVVPVIEAASHPSVRRLPVILLPLLELMPGFWS